VGSKKPLRFNRKILLQRFKVKCGQYQIDLAEADINKDFKEVLLAYLVKAEKVILKK
jgi:hypothetical protein